MRKWNLWIVSPRYKEILCLALPLIAGTISNFFFQVADAAVLASLGDKFVGAAALGATFAFFFMALLMGASFGIQFMISRGWESAPEESRSILQKSFWHFLVLGTLGALLSYSLLPFWLKLQGTDTEVFALSRLYMLPLALSLVPYAINRIFVAYLVGSRRTRPILYVTLAAQSLSILLSFSLVRGLGPFPPLGIVGSSLATLSAALFESCCYWWQLKFKADHPRALKDLKFLKAFVKSGSGPGLNQVSFSVFWNLLHALVNGLGTTSLSVFSIFLKFSLLPTYTFFGIGTAAGTLSAAPLARQDLPRFREIGRSAFAVALGLALLLLVSVAPFSPLILKQYFSAPESLQLAFKSLPIFAIYILFDAIGLSLQRLLIGVGEGQRVFRINVRNQILWGLGLSYLCAQHLELGLMGIWLGQVTYRAANALELFWRWKYVGGLKPLKWLAG
jgi:MATE family multidrug resistance protein